MKHTSVFLCLAIFSIFLSAAAQSKQKDTLRSSTQMIEVTTADWGAVEGVLVRYERARGGKRWKQVGDPVTVVVGRSGMGWGVGALPTDSAHDPHDPVKKEGDGKSPAGVFALSTAFGYAPQPEAGWRMPYMALTPSVECVDDSASRFYNRVLDRNTVSPDWHSSEQMRRSDEAYRVGLVVEHNTPPTPGSGSCIFLHIWFGRGQGTSGCTAMPQEQVEILLAWLDPARSPMLVQLPDAQYKKLKRNWHLPKRLKSSGK
jgi:D-alanyl-D-alanine dipeptidase